MIVQMRQVSRYVYDIFFDKGFDQHVRVRSLPRGISRVFGVGLSDATRLAIQRCIVKNPFGSVDPIQL